MVGIKKSFTVGQVEAIQNFAVKKLGVRDLYKLRDRFEGQAFLNNTIKKVYTLWHLFEVLEIPNYNGFKIGYLNTLDIPQNIGIDLLYINTIDEIRFLNLKNNQVASYVNYSSRSCDLFYSHLDKENIKCAFVKKIETIKDLIYV